MPRHFEDAEQEAVFQWAAFFPILRWMHAIPNGGKRDKIEAARLRRQGVKAGVSDIFLPLARQGYHGLYIEMKRRAEQGPSRETEKQKAFGRFVTEEGYLRVVCYGADQAIQVIKDYARI